MVRVAVNVLNIELTRWSSVGGNVSVETSITAPEGSQGAQTEAEVVPTAETGTEGQKNNAPEGEGNIRLTEKDENEYAQTGNRQQIKAAKREAVASGEKIVLTNQEETRAYIHQAISGETKNVITKAFGRGGASMADDIYNKSNGAFDVEGWYLELVPSDLRHAYIQHSQAKQDGNIPLTEDDFLSVPDYIDNYDDIISCKTFKNGEREIVLGKKINGYSVIVEIVSKSRKSLAFKNMWGMDTAVYEAKYKNSTEYRPNRSSDVANDSTRTHNDAVLEGSVPQPTPSVNPEVSEKIQGTPDGNEKHSGSPVGSTGIDVSGDRGPESNISPQLAFVKGIIDDAIGAAKNGRADIAQVINRIEETATTEETARAAVEEYQNLFAGGEYATDAQGKVYKTGGETDLSLDERREDQYILGKRNINAFQFDHPQVHKFYVEAANMLLDDIGQTTRGERIFSWRPDQSAPVVSGVKRQTSGPIASLRDDYNMPYARIEDVLNRIINDKGQENIADAKRVETILDDILRNGYESMRGPVAPNTEYIETLRQMGQVGEEVTAGTETAAEPVDDALPLPQEPGGRNLSAAERGFTTPTRGDIVYTQNNTMNAGADITQEESERYAPGVHEQVTEEMSLERALGQFYQDNNGRFTNLEDTVDTLLEKETWTGVDQDAAQIAFRWMNAHRHDLTDEQYSRFWALHRAIEEIGGTEAGRSLQARQKWVESGDGIVSKSMSIMDDPRIDRKAARKVIEHVQDLSEKFDRAVSDENNVAFAGIIREVAVERNTTKTRANGEIKKTAEWALRQIMERGDAEFLKSAARSSIVAMAQDYVPQSVTARLKAVRRDAMLSKISTWARNVVSNNVFDPIDSIARDISVPLDMALSKITGTRSTGLDASWFSKAKREGTKYGLARSFLEVSLDISAEGAESKYGQAGNRTFKMTGGVFSRFMSQWEKISNYAMYSTDQMQKGGIEAEVQQGVDRLYEQGKITDDSLRDAGAQEAAFRTFQEDSAIAKGLSVVRRGLNQIAHVGDIGLGDILMPFVQVPANLVNITVDYSPLGMARGIYRLTDTLIDAKNGTMTAAQQARAVQTVGRSLTGTAVLALAVLAKMGGALIISDDGRDEDKDKSALESQAGLSGTQINLSAVKRLITGESAEKQSGDVLMSIGFMDPINALLNMGGLIADDFVAEHEGEKNGITFGEIMKDAVSGVTQSVMDLPMMSPIADAAQAYQYSKADTEGGRWMDAAEQYAAGQVTSLIPNNLKGIAQGTDTKKRDLYSGQTLGEQVVDSVLGSVPGLRQRLPAKLDSYGEEISTGNRILNFLNNNILPGSVVQYQPRNEEIEKLLDDIYSATDSVTQYPDRNPPNSISKDTDGDGKTEKYVLTADEKRQYQKTQGSIFEDLVGQIFDAGKDAFTPEELLDIVSGIKSYAGSEAKREYFEENDIDAAVQSNFIAKAVTAGKEADIPYVVYMTYHGMMGNLDYEKGVSEAKKAAVVKVIDSLNLSPEQKDYLYLGEGYAENSINETPWH